FGFRMEALGVPLTMSLLDPKVVSGILIGVLLVFLFSALTMNAVGRAAMQVVNEVRRQWHEIKGIMTGEARPDYARCVDITTRSALKEMVLPGLLAIVVPVAVGMIPFLGPDALGGLLIGALGCGFLLAVTMANAGGTWDNAKKYIELGHFGGKGSEQHKAAVVGDTVGDPFKDTSGPSLNILIKLMSMVSLLFAPIFAQMM
ncbi:sodium/proton-translocating pyrophosphatase, partial [Dehalococcoidia bacterium]|nr:sodium/proton-translocating pyrophosphatase [Dehalococcoidia bacterium]